MATKALGRRVVYGSRWLWLCPRCTAATGWHQRPRFLTTATTTTTTTTTSPPHTPLRKQIKDETKARKRAAAAAAAAQGQQGQQGQQGADWRRAQTVPGWELTVGIEIHAQLNTAHKLFSRAAATTGEAAEPNTRVAYFDAALPGAQPQFQAAVLVPAVRAALALGCAVQAESRFDRKHYFHWDQPAGYQITQYYAPLARGGRVVVRGRDGAAGGAEAADVAVDIVQVQLEQDTAKTLAQPGLPGGGEGQVHWLDLNRAGAPLVEIISAPQIRHPATAAAFVRKVQQLLRAVDACTAGMEAGGLRADVNVSVRRAGAPVLGTRTEIKNLNSFRAVEDAVLAERNRQIAVLAAGGAVEGETRGWTPGTGSENSGGTTHRLRSKAGEVDYRYMPDPDLAPVRIDPALPAYLALTLGVLPDAEVDALVARHGLTPKDALALTQLDDGGRAQFYYDVVAAFEARLGAAPDAAETAARRAFVANWVLHQLGRLTSERSAAAAAAGAGAAGAAAPADLQMTPAGRCRIPAAGLAELLALRHQGRITAGVAKELLFALFRGEIGGAAGPTVAAAVDAGGLWFREIAAAEYAALARQALDGEAKTLRPFVEHAAAAAAAAAAGTGSAKAKKYPLGKLQYLTGKLMRLAPEGRTDPQAAEAAMRRAVEEYVGGGSK